MAPQSHCARGRSKRIAPATLADAPQAKRTGGARSAAASRKDGEDLSRRRIMWATDGVPDLGSESVPHEAEVRRHKTAPIREL